MVGLNGLYVGLNGLFNESNRIVGRGFSIPRILQHFFHIVGYFWVLLSVSNRGYGSFFTAGSTGNSLNKVIDGVRSSESVIFLVIVPLIFDFSP